TLGVRDDGGLSTFEDGDDGVRRPEVDTDRTSHGVYLQLRPGRAAGGCLGVCAWSAGFRRGCLAAASLSNNLSRINSTLVTQFNADGVDRCSRRGEEISRRPADRLSRRGPGPG